MTTHLLLYTEAPTRRVFERHRPGRLILASDEITPEDRRVYDRCVQLPPVTDVPATLRALGRIRADEVVMQTEYGLLPGALLLGRDLAPIHRCINKWLSRCTLSAAGIRLRRFALVDNAAAVRRFADRYPIVLKPVASTLGRLVTRVDRPEDVAARVAQLQTALPQAIDVRRYLSFARAARLDMGCDPTRQFLVEEYVKGPPLETDGLIFGDRIVCFGVTGQVMSPPPRFFIESYVFPVRRPRLEEITARALRAIGLRDAGFSVEFRGETLIEVNGRLGEDDGFPDMFHAALGVYPILKWMARDASPVRPRARAALAYCNWYGGGRIRAIESLDGAVPLARRGQRLFVPPHRKFEPHLAWSLATGPSARRRARESIARLRLDIR